MPINAELAIAEDGSRAVESSTFKLDAAAVQFHRKQGIAIYRAAGGKRMWVSPDADEFVEDLDCRGLPL